MDRSVLEEKLESLRLILTRLESKRPATKESVQNDPDLQDILSLNLQRAIQVCVDIAAHIVANQDGAVPKSMAESFESLASSGILTEQMAAAMGRAVAFRNILVHEYRKVDWDLVYQNFDQGLADLRAFGKQIADAKLDASPG